MSTPSLLRLNQSVEDGGAPPLLRASLSLDYANKPAALDRVEFAIGAGEILGLVGESGSGKSSVALCLMRLLRGQGNRLTGSADFDGRDLLSLSEAQMRRLRGSDIALVLQSPLAALNPALRLRTQFEEAWRAHKPSRDRDAMGAEIRTVLEMASLPSEAEFLHRYPRQLSVGLAQRVLIAMALLHRPRLLIADEPTSALDPITAAEILRLFRNLNQRLGMAILFISHDLLSVASLCHRVAIMKAGRIVECASTDEVFERPQHDYTRALVAAVPSRPHASACSESAGVLPTR